MAQEVEQDMTTSKEVAVSGAFLSKSAEQTKYQESDEVVICRTAVDDVGTKSEASIRQNDSSKRKLQVGQKYVEKRNTEAVSSAIGGSRDDLVLGQPAGESSVSQAPSGGDTNKSKQRKQRSQSETTITSYGELEERMKDNGSHWDHCGDDTEDQKATPAASERIQGSLPPTTVLVPSPDTTSDSSLPVDPHSPPDMITTEGPVRSFAPETSSSSRSRQGSLRRGKWTVEEEAYVARVIQDFNSGFLDAPAGTTLRTYLSEKLQCDPMRITKKFTGDACIGKRVFHPAVRSPSNAAAIDKAQMELENLEKRWRRRLEMQQRESAKKAAASAAAVAAGRGPNGISSGSSEESMGKGSQEENVVAKTASWLDRAKSVLKDPGNGQTNLQERNDLRTQMQEVQRLINEGPVIRQTSADLPDMIDKAEEQAHRVALVEPADKRMRTAEDAEALVGFLRSVRASAASGEDF